MRIVFFRSAADELIEAAECHESELRGLGYRFLSEVERVAALLCELPSLGENLDPIHRRIPLRRFPYGLIIRRDGDLIHVVAVAHRRRRPLYWAGRVHDRGSADARSYALAG